MTTYLWGEESRIREIVREELHKVGNEFVRSIPFTKAVLEGIAPQPKPKTDLERAARLCEDGKALHSPAMYPTYAEYSRGWQAALAWAAESIRLIQPSPDWRKIAEGLADSLRYRSHVAVEPDPYNCSCNRRLEAYDAAVKEESQ